MHGRKQIYTKERNFDDQQKLIVRNNKSESGKQTLPTFVFLEGIVSAFLKRLFWSCELVLNIF